MSISAEEKVCYLREAAIVLAKEGFQLDEVHTDRLCILLDGAPLCEVTESGGIAYRNKDIDEPERIAAKDKVYEIVRNTAEYMRQMETAPVLKADGLEDGYKVLADFNGTVLAGVQSTILLCLDNDEAGHQASRRMREQLEMRYSVERLIPENKDWNDDLTLSGENAQGFSMNEMR